MPMFQYQCTKCATITEKFQKYTDTPPLCAADGEPTEKLISTPAFHFVNGKGTANGALWAIPGKTTAPGGGRW